jgi:hypothetical protein
MRGERGAALVASMLVAMVALSLATTGIQLVATGQNQSAHDRRFLAALHAAQSGIDRVIGELPTRTGVQVCAAVSGTLPTKPPSRYETSLTALDETGSPTTCGEDSAPASLLVTSTGTSSPGYAHPVSRTLRAEIVLTPIREGFDQAVLSNTNLDVLNSLNVRGSAPSDADVYTNGNLTISNGVQLAGSAYAAGTITVKDAAVVHHDVWAGRSVALSGNPVVFGDAMSSRESVLLSQRAHVLGDASAGTTVSITNAARVDGSVVHGRPLGPPPVPAFPRLVWDTGAEAAWRDAGYEIHRFPDCVQAAAFLRSLPARDVVVRIESGCTLAFGNNETLAIPGNLAVVTNGSIALTNNITVAGSGNLRDVTLMVPVPASGVADCTTGSISVANSVSFSSVRLFAFTPCTLSFANNSTPGVRGQLVGGDIDITNRTTITFDPPVLPVSEVTGYAAGVAYFHEISGDTG